MADVSPDRSIITLNLNCLTSEIKRETGRMDEKTYKPTMTQLFAAYTELM